MGRVALRSLLNQKGSPGNQTQQIWYFLTKANPVAVSLGEIIAHARNATKHHAKPRHTLINTRTPRHTDTRTHKHTDMQTHKQSHTPNTQESNFKFGYSVGGFNPFWKASESLLAYTHVLLDPGSTFITELLVQPSSSMCLLKGTMAGSNMCCLQQNES